MRNGVYQVRNYSVSWVRTRDSAILSIDGETVVQDVRVTVVRHPARGDWLLSIRYCNILLVLNLQNSKSTVHQYTYTVLPCSDVQAEDEGQYECQVSMSRKLSMFIHLSVLGKFC